MKKHSILLLGFGMLLFGSCSKDAMNDLNNESLSTQQVQAQMKANGATEGLDEMLSQLLINSKSPSTNKTNTDCATLSFTEESISVTYTQCEVRGNILNGTLILTGKGGSMEDPKGIYVVDFKDFTYNSYVLNGTKSLAFDFSKSGNPTFTIVTDMKLVGANDVVTTHKGSKVFTWHLENYNTEEADVSCTGAWDIVHNETTYKFKVTTPLTGKLGCAYITSGVLALEVEGLTASLDFGEGDCDKKGTVSYPNGKSEEISW